VAGPAPFSAARDGIRLAVQLVPKSAADRVVGLVEQAGGGTALKVAVRAAPREGAANEALLRFVADLFRVRRGDVSLALGATQRRKLVHIAGDPARLARHVAETLGPWLTHD
jgi:uncharacterized protein (TIGR00251 family)